MNTAIILKVRAESLRVNLDKIRNHLENVPDRRTNLNVLVGCLKNMGNSLRNARKAISDAKIDLDSDSTSPDLAKELGEADEQMRNLFENLKRANSCIESMQKECFRIQDDQIGKDIAKDLDRRTKPCIQRLADVEANLQKEAANLPQEWKNFLAGADEARQSIFEEYIEFLGGLALRDTRFDEGISRVADELVRTYSTKKNLDSMLAIPTRRQAVAMTLARIIRVTFPDWTIWALPSTAHEFWQVVAKNDLDGRLRSELRALTSIDTDTVELRFNDCLGDAFATYTMGPAYAFFAIFLLLDPSSPFTSMADNAADDVRAYGICQMLACMDSKESEMDPPYATLQKELSEVWEAAIAQTGVKPKSDEEKRKVEADKLRVAILVNALWTTLTDSTSSQFTVDMWNEIKTWVDPLLKNKVDQIKVPHGAELRHVLNAAWLARVDPNRSPKFDITAAANELARRITTVDER